MPPTTRDVDQYVASMNSIKRQPAAAFMENRFPPVMIYNIYQMKHGPLWGQTGGPYTIPACEEGKLFSRPLIVKGLIQEDYSLGDGLGTMGLRHWEGLQVAEDDIVGKKSYTPGNTTLSTNLEWKGVFVSKEPQKCPDCQGDPTLVGLCATCYSIGTIPSQAELDRALGKLIEHMRMWLADGDAVAAANDPKSPIQEPHRRAAKFLRQSRTWSNPVVPMVECPSCGSAIKPGFASCPHCQAVLDIEKDRHFHPDRYSAPQAMAKK